MNKRRSLLKKIGIILVSVIVSFIVIAILYFYYTQKSSTKKYFQNHIKNSEVMVKYGLSNILWNLNYTGVKKVVLALLESDDIIAINIYEADNIFLSAHKLNYKKNKDNIVVSAEGSKYTNSSDSYLLKISGDILYRNKKFGKYEIYYTDYFIRQELFRSLFNIIIVLMIIAVLLIFTIYSSISINVINPILKLAKFTEKVSSNMDINSRLQYRYNDELGTLYDGFNTMLSRVKDYIYSINKQKQELDRKQEKLINARKLFNNIIEAMPSMVITINMEGHITHWNKAVDDNFEFNFQEMNNETLWYENSFFKQFRESVKEVLSTRETIEYEKVDFYSGESHRIKNVTIFPLDKNSNQGAVIRLDDITDAEQKESQLRQSQKMDTIGTLAGGLAHDLNNSLSGIVGTVSIINFKLYTKNEDISIEAFKDHIKTIETSANRATEMVKRLLTLSRKSELNLCNFDMRETVEHVVKICRNTFDKSIVINVKMPSSPAYINADSANIEQIILNICVNAYHAMTIMRTNSFDRKGILTIELKQKIFENTEIKNYLHIKKDRYWILSITDTGVGIPRENQEIIFDPFYTTKSEKDGTGLGLSMVYSMIKKHHGILKLYSEIGIGSSFHVYLPAIEVEEDKNTLEKTLFLPENTDYRILICDDEEILRNLSNNVLQSIGYDTYSVADGMLCLREYKEQHFDLVILDLIMPGISGLETFKLLKEYDPDVKVIMCSGFKEDGRIKQALDLGAIAFLQKPYTVEDMLKITRNIDNLF